MGLLITQGQGLQWRQQPLLQLLQLEKGCHAMAPGTALLQMQAESTQALHFVRGWTIANAVW